MTEKYIISKFTHNGDFVQFMSIMDTTEPRTFDTVDEAASEINRLQLKFPYFIYHIYKIVMVK